MKPINSGLLNKTVPPYPVCVLPFAALLLCACTTQQAYEGLKAGLRANCLEYPESEFNDCMDQTKTSYREYRRQREAATGH